MGKSTKAKETPVPRPASMVYLDHLVQAGVPIIWVRTHEEVRFIQDFRRVIVPKHGIDLWSWSTVQGLRRIKDDESITAFSPGPSGVGLEKSDKIKDALNIIATTKPSKTDGRQVFIMKDMHTQLAGSIPRQIRDMYGLLEGTSKTLLIVSPHIEHGGKEGIEPTLEKQIAIVDFELPSHTLLKLQVVGAAEAAGITLTNEEMDELATAIQGLTTVEAENAITSCLSATGSINVPYLLKEKKQVIARSKILEYIDVAPSFLDVGGCDKVKEYFLLYRTQFTPAAREFGVEPLKGVLMTGVPGTGKSLLAKAVAATWQIPLLRLDVGKVMAGIVGASEERMRMVIDQAEAVAPCVLWIDEIEKSLSGTKSSGMTDGGTMSRVFSTLLTAMEERMDGVVVIATANDISSLPPELIRRFNEVFFVDLPTASERREIFQIHLRKKKRDTKQLLEALDPLIKRSDKYTGSEIEKAVHTAIAMAFTTGPREITVDDLMKAVEDTKPIFTVMKEKISEIRGWANGRARYASSEAQKLAQLVGTGTGVITSGGEVLSVEDDLAELDEIVSKSEQTEETNKQAKKNNRIKKATALLDSDEIPAVVIEQEIE